MADTGKKDCGVEDCLFPKPCSLALKQDLHLNQSFVESVLWCPCFPHPNSESPE